MFKGSMGRILIIFLLVSVLPTIAQAKKKDTGPANLYLQTVLDKFDRIGKNMPIITRAADSTAERLANGGNLYIASDEQGFASEGLGRAGGFMLLKGLPSTTQPKDVVLIGSIGASVQQQIEQIRTIRKAGTLVVGFGSSKVGPSDTAGSSFSLFSSEVDFFIENFLPAGTVPIIPVKGRDEKICPIAGVINIANLWVFSGELVAALTRKGKMPTMYQSIYVKGGVERNASLSGKDFHNDLTIAPIKAGQLGRSYIETIRGYLKGIQSTELLKCRKAGEIAALALKANKKLWCYSIGHFLPSQKGIPGDPGLFNISDQADTNQYKALVKKGDVFLVIGYAVRPGGLLNDYESLLKLMRASGVTSICTIAGEEGISLNTDLIDLYIDPKWKLGDAIVTVPGYDVKILPPSGLIQASILWMVTGETAQALSGGTTSVEEKRKGDASSNLPDTCMLDQSFPNPFNSSAMISYAISSDGFVDLSVYGINGKSVSTLWRGGKTAGRYSVTWDGKNESGKEVASGMYFYRLKLAETSLTLKMIFVH